MKVCRHAILWNRTYICLLPILIVHSRKRLISTPTGCLQKVLILTNDLEKKRVTLSTRKLEPSPGDMLKNPEKVFEKAEEMAATFRERIAMAEAAAEVEYTFFSSCKKADS